MKSFLDNQVGDGTKIDRAGMTNGKEVQMKTKEKITSIINTVTCSGFGEEKAVVSTLENGTNKPKKEGLGQKIRRHMAAAAYAEAGEYQSARDILEPQAKTKTVLFVIAGSTPDPSAVSYALNYCSRTGAELDVLLVIEKSSDEDYSSLGIKMNEGSKNIVGLVREIEEKEIPFKITIRLGDVHEKLLNYARRHKDVVMVIYDSPKIHTSKVKNRAWTQVVENISRQLSVPFITVLEKPQT
jgi:hypothetical protein